MNYNWNWSVFWDPSPEGVGTYLDTLFLGLGWTLATGLAAGALALFLGTIVGTATTAPNKAVRILANSYIELFRNIPLLAQMFIWYFVLPELLPLNISNWIKQSYYSSFYTAVVSLGLYTASPIAVQINSGINALGRGQVFAGMALGFTLPQTYRYVLLPVVFRILIPPLTSEFMGVIKNSAVALTIGLVELTARSRAMQEYTFQTFEAFTAATVMYIVISLSVVKVMSGIEKLVAIPGFVTTVSAETSENT